MYCSKTHMNSLPFRFPSGSLSISFSNLTGIRWCLTARFTLLGYSGCTTIITWQHLLEVKKQFWLYIIKCQTNSLAAIEFDINDKLLYFDILKFNTKKCARLFDYSSPQSRAPPQIKHQVLAVTQHQIQLEPLKVYGTFFQN